MRASKEETMATKEETALQTMTTYFDHKTGNVPAAMAVLEQAVKERAELVKAVLDAMVELGPSCLVCGEAIETDTDPCDVPCAGLTLRRLVKSLQA